MQTVTAGLWMYPMVYRRVPIQSHLRVKIVCGPCDGKTATFGPTLTWQIVVSSKKYARMLNRQSRGTAACSHRFSLSLVFDFILFHRCAPVLHTYGPEHFVVVSRLSFRQPGRSYVLAFSGIMQRVFVSLRVASTLISVRSSTWTCAFRLHFPS